MHRVVVVFFLEFVQCSDILLRWGLVLFVHDGIHEREKCCLSSSVSAESSSDQPILRSYGSDFLCNWSGTALTRTDKIQKEACVNPNWSFPLIRRVDLQEQQTVIHSADTFWVAADLVARLVCGRYQCCEALHGRDFHNTSLRSSHLLHQSYRNVVGFRWTSWTRLCSLPFSVFAENVSTAAVFFHVQSVSRCFSSHVGRRKSSRLLMSAISFLVRRGLGQVSSLAHWGLQSPLLGLFLSYRLRLVVWPVAHYLDKL